MESEIWISPSIVLLADNYVNLVTRRVRSWHIITKDRYTPPMGKSVEDRRQIFDRPGTDEGMAPEVPRSRIALHFAAEPISPNWPAA